MTDIWTASEDDALRDYVPVCKSWKEVAEHFPGRTYHGVTCRARKLRLKLGFSRDAWSGAEDERLASMKARGYSNEDIASELGRTVGAVELRVWRRLGSERRAPAPNEYAAGETLPVAEAISGERYIARLKSGELRVLRRRDDGFFSAYRRCVSYRVEDIEELLYHLNQGQRTPSEIGTTQRRAESVKHISLEHEQEEDRIGMLRRFWRGAASAWARGEFMQSRLDESERDWLSKRKLSSHIVYFGFQSGLPLKDIAWMLRDSGAQPNASQHSVSVRKIEMGLPGKASTRGAKIGDERAEQAISLFEEGASLAEMQALFAVSEDKLRSWLKAAQ